MGENGRQGNDGVPGNDGPPGESGPLGNNKVSKFKYLFHFQALLVKMENLVSVEERS